jgi:hypothetical protein
VTIVALQPLAPEPAIALSETQDRPVTGEDPTSTRAAVLRRIPCADRRARAPLTTAAANRPADLIRLLILWRGGGGDEASGVKAAAAAGRCRDHGGGVRVRGEAARGQRRGEQGVPGPVPGRGRPGTVHERIVEEREREGGRDEGERGKKRGREGVREGVREEEERDLIPGRGRPDM